MAEERIQKIMSEQGLCSRRAAEQIIAEGRVKVNGHPVKVGDKMDPNRDVLHVDDERIYIQKNQQMYYLALYKPRGYVTTASDELGRKTVMELVADIPARLYPVGRLDKDSEGLLLMTNDGAFAQAVTHPSGGISKLYRVTVQPRADEAQILKLSSGVVLDDGTKTMPCAINVVTDEPGRTVMEMTLKEGKNREIRRMCEAVGLEVIRLKRNAEGVVKLGMLQPGKYRELTKAEVNGLRAAPPPAASRPWPLPSRPAPGWTNTKTTSPKTSRSSKTTKCPPTPRAWAFWTRRAAVFPTGCALRTARSATSSWWCPPPGTWARATTRACWARWKRPLSAPPWPTPSAPWKSCAQCTPLTPAWPAPCTSLTAKPTKCTSSAFCNPA